MRLADLRPCTVQNSLVLFLEVCSERWAVAAPVTLSGDGDSVIVGFVLYENKWQPRTDCTHSAYLRKFLEPHLSEVPESSC